MSHVPAERSDQGRRKKEKGKGGRGKGRERRGRRRGAIFFCGGV
jgi:hypothetical protein